MNRSYLFVPADSERKLAKAEGVGADALILDLDYKTLVARCDSNVDVLVRCVQSVLDDAPQRLLDAMKRNLRTFTLCLLSNADGDSI